MKRVLHALLLALLAGPAFADPSVVVRDSVEPTRKLVVNADGSINTTATVSGSGVAQNSTTSGQSGPLTQCAVTTSAPTYTTAKTDPLSCDTAGNVRTSAQPSPAPAGSGNVLWCYLNIKATATACGTSAPKNLIGWHVGNVDNTAVGYVQLFNLAAGSVTLGTTVPNDTIPLSASGGNNFAYPWPVSYSTALTAACTTTSTGLTAPANNCTITLYYTN